MKVLQEPSRHTTHPGNKKPLASHYHTRKAQDAAPIPPKS
jgi:hypothetical protein